jgi:hypothetical protein
MAGQLDEFCRMMVKQGFLFCFSRQSSSTKKFLELAFYRGAILAIVEVGPSIQDGWRDYWGRRADCSTA